MVKWTMLGLDLMNDVPLMIMRCTYGGKGLQDLPRKNKVPDGSGLVFVGSGDTLLNNLDNFTSTTVRNHDPSGLGIFFYRLGKAHGGLRALGWGLGAPVSVTLGLAGAAYGDIRRSQFLPRRVPVADMVEGDETRLRWQAPSISTDYASAACVAAAGVTGDLGTFGLQKRTCVIIFPSRFRFDDKEFGGKAVWQIGHTLTLSAVATVCRNQLGG